MREIIRNFRKAHEDCNNDYSAEHPSCLEHRTAWEAAKNEMAKFRSSEYRIIRAAASDTAEEFDIQSARFSAQHNRYQDAISPMLQIQDRLMELNLKTMELFREYTKLEGATGQIIWSIPWDQLLEDYRHMNPNFEGELVSLANKRS